MRTGVVMLGCLAVLCALSTVHAVVVDAEDDVAEPLAPLKVVEAAALVPVGDDFAAEKARFAARSSTCSEVDMNEVFDMLSTMVSVLKKYKYQYWIMYGTLLGIEREGDIIEGDDDADIGMLESEAKKLWDNDAAQHAFIKAGYKLVRSINNDYKLYPISSQCATSSSTDLYFPECCSNVDIFQFRHMGKCAVRDCFNKWKEPCGANGRDLTLDSVPYNYIFPLDEMKVVAWDMTVSVPHSPEKVLAHVYGDNWRTPKPGYKGVRQGCKP